MERIRMSRPVGSTGKFEISSCRGLGLASCLVVLFSLPSSQAQAQTVCAAGTEVAYPSGGTINVKSFGAKGDGITDDTAAILQAIDPTQTLTGPYTSPGVINPLAYPVYYNKPVYFPAGTYLVSNTLEKRLKDKVSAYLGLPNGRYFSGLILLGACQNQTIIKLKDGSPGFTDSSNPKAVIFAASSMILGLSGVVDSSGNLLAGRTPADVVATSKLGGKDYINLGEGNDAYMNFIENITVDVGKGNPGAIGIDFLGSNVAGIRNVAVRDLYGSGSVGINMKRFGPGPCYVKNVQVTGFDVGIDASQPEYTVTLEHIRVDGSRVSGLRNNQNSLAIRDLTITASGGVPAITNLSPAGLIVIVDGLLQNTTPSMTADAVQNAGYINIRNVHVTGFTKLFGAASPVVADGVYFGTEFLSKSSVSWSLPIQDPPDIPLGPLANGADVTTYGADATGLYDSTTAIQAALNSGKATVYFPNGQYQVTNNLVVPATVQRIEGLFSTIRKGAWVNPQIALFQVQNSNAPFEVSHLNFDNANLGSNISFSVSGTGPFLVRDSFNNGITAVQSLAATGGHLFIENIATSGLSFAGPGQIWARQLDSEGGGTRVRNNNADLWILGIKTEGNTTAVSNSGVSSRAEILGGCVYNVNTANPAIPAFKNTDGEIAVSYVEEAFSAATAYTIQVQDVKNGVTYNHNDPEFPPRMIAGRQFYPRIVPQFSTTP